MATYNFNIKISTGKRSEIEVVCYSTSYSEKDIVFKDSTLVTDNKRVARWLQKTVQTALKEAATKHKS